MARQIVAQYRLTARDTATWDEVQVQVDILGPSDRRDLDPQPERVIDIVLPMDYEPSDGLRFDIEDLRTLVGAKA